MSQKTKTAHSALPDFSRLTQPANFQPFEHRTKYTYDKIGQIKTETSSVSTENRGYAYDSAWNLSWLTNTVGRAYTVDGKNELTNWPGNPATYDGNGNRITQNSGSGATTLTYDDENRLTSWVQSTAYNSGFAYDGLGRLRRRIDYTWTGMSWYPNTTTVYIYDGNRVIQERDGNNNMPLVSYTRGTDLSGSLEGAGGIGGLLARSSGYSSGNWTTNHFYHADGSGNITYLVDSNQAMAATYRYDAFGDTLSSSGPLATANMYRFSSREQHTASGMYVYLYRFYDPGSQRWLNRDPLGERGGINLYRFVGNNPVNWIDRNGLDIWIGNSGFHQNINVGDPNGNYSSYSFGLEGSRLNIFNPFSQGSVYEDDPPAERDPSYGYLKTTTAQDQQAIDILNQKLGQPHWYSLFFNNCRDFAQDTFKDLKATFPGTYVAPPPTPPIPADGRYFFP